MERKESTAETQRDADKELIGWLQRVIGVSQLDLEADSRTEGSAQSASWQYAALLGTGQGAGKHERQQEKPCRAGERIFATDGL